jgi:hypothetical protein
MRIDDLKKAIRAGKVRITDHADEEATADRLTLDEIYSSVLEGEIIETYPTDRPYPSCLVFGRTPKGDPVHSVWGYNDKTGSAVLITVYRPDPNRWIEWRVRRQE